MTSIKTEEVKAHIIDAFKSMATFQNFMFVAWFLSVYSITYTITTLFQNPQDPTRSERVFNRSADFLILCSVLFLVVYYYLSLNDTDKQNLALHILSLFRVYLEDLNSIFKMIIVMTFFYLIMYGFKINMGFYEKPATISFVEKILWIITLLLLFVQFFQYAFKISVTDIVFGKRANGGSSSSGGGSSSGDDDDGKHKVEKKSDSKESPTTTTKNTEDKKSDKSNNKDHPLKKQTSNVPEVFNIANNLYNYEEAQEVCEALGARLATAEEINKAYEDGAEWCVNSWSDNMLVLYPTQEQTYQKLQKIKGAENRCGRTGVNGGKVDNSKLRFGVNCFGIKPAPSEFEQTRMTDVQNAYSNIPKTKEDFVREAKINYWVKNKDKFMVINPFNKDKWNEV